MAYDRKKIFQQAKEAIVKNKLFFVEDVVAYLPCDKTSFYRFFPVDCNEYNELKELLEQNKTEIKVSMRSKWYKSENATLQMALYKIIANEDELRRLSVVKNEIAGNEGKAIDIAITVLGNDTPILDEPKDEM
jgi:hypothetical protein